MSLIDVALYISSDYKKTFALQLFAEDDKKKRSAIKRTKLDYFTPAGVFTKRHSSALQSLSGFCVFDFDNIAQPVPFLMTCAGFETLAMGDDIPPIHLALAWVSPSGRGVKCIYDISDYLAFYRLPIGTPLNDKLRQETEEVFRKLFNHASAFTGFGASLDVSGKDPARACYLAPTPSYYIPYYTLKLWKSLSN